MRKVITDRQGNVLMTSQGEAYLEPDLPPVEPETFTGHVDTVGLTALGWDSYDIAWLQEHVWWDEEDDNKWKVSEANLAFGPNGSTPLVWADRAAQKNNPDIVFFPKFTLAPASNTSWANLMNDWKWLCAIPTHGWDTTNVTSLYGLFSQDYQLRSVGDISGWNTAKVTSLYNTFYYCTSLRYVDVSNWNTSKVASMYGMFNTCTSITHIGDLSNWDTSSVTTLGYMFNSCNKLSYVGELATWNTSKVTNLALLFANCNFLTSVNLSSWDVSKVTNFGSLFNTCRSLSSVGDLSKWDTSSAKNFSSMFYYCYSLKGVGDISAWNTSKVTTFYYMFTGCHYIESFGDLSKWDTSKVEGTGFANMFQSCYRLRYIGDLSTWDVSLGTTLAQMFQDCYLLESVGDLSNWDISNKTTIAHMFSCARSLTAVNVTNWDTSQVTTMLGTFSQNYSLEEVDISGWDTASVASNSMSNSVTSGLLSTVFNTKVIRLGSKFFNSACATYYFDRARSWTRDSVVESLYTNQTLRNSSSPAKTVRLWSAVYDSLTQEDISNISSKNITLVRSTTV